MIERLLAGEAALADGDLTAAARLFQQVADADVRNAIAVVGLARVALRRGDHEMARATAERALSIDPEEAAATRLLAELDRAPELDRAAEPAPEPEPAPEAAPGPQATEPARLRGWRGWLARLLRRS